jgi:Novel STAND NTPase 1/TIR domain
MEKQKRVPLTVFYAYAHEDERLREELMKHLRLLSRQGLISEWYDHQVVAGRDWETEIDEHLNTASIILLLVSSDFLASDYCYDKEMQRALERHKRNEAHVIPILLRPCDWPPALDALQPLPRNGRPVTSWSDHDEAFRLIASEIRTLIQALQQSVVLVSCLSYQGFTQRLVGALEARGIPTLEAMEKSDQASLKDFIREASTTVVIASSKTEHASMLKETLRISEMYQRPLLGIWISSEKQDDALPAFPPSQRQEWITVCPGQEEYVVQQICVALCSKRSHDIMRLPVSAQGEPEISLVPRNPYKGLRAFTVEDAHDFFGRASLLETLLTSLKAILSREQQGQFSSRLLAVVGASGSGKSSVVHAGLLPALQSGRIFGSDRWVYLDQIIPGTNPLDTLALALFEHFPEKSLKTLQEDLRDEPARSLHLYTTALARRCRCTHTVLVVDQFEEVFTLSANEQERQQFLDLLITACTKPGGSLIVILTLRADFYDRLMQYPLLYTLVADHLIPMLPMALPDLRDVIIQPASLPDVQLTFEGNLVGDMLFDIQGQIGTLPLLQFALVQLFERREGHVLTEHAYREIGGIKGALTKYAEEIYLSLPSDEHRQHARTLFMRLLDPGISDQETTRRRARQGEFLFADLGQTLMMQETLHAFVAARLLTTTADEKTGITTIEVSHEALIREWFRLLNWLREARDDVRLQQDISRDVAMWEQYQRPGDRLYQGMQLKEAQSWAKRNIISRQEQVFLHASAARQRRTLFTLVVIILLVITSSGVAGWYYINRPPTHGYVTTTDEYATGSLRWAIGNAVAGDTITFAPDLVGQTIVLKHADIHIFQQHLTIRGPATGRVTIREIGASIINDTSASTTIANMTFKGSNVKGQMPLLQNTGKLALYNCTLSDNVDTNADGGGGIFNIGSMTIDSSSISDNRASDAIPYSTPTGGGILNSGTMVINNSTISDNTAPAGNGGGIENTSSFKTDLTNPYNMNSFMVISNSTISGNISGANGGGIDNNYATLTINNSTISDNTGANGGSISSGEGVVKFNNPFYNTSLNFCTIVNNSSNNDSIFIWGLTNLYIKANIIGENSATAPKPAKEIVTAADDYTGGSALGTVISEGYNVIEHLSSVPFAPGSIHGLDISVSDLTHVLGPSPKLQKNGGPTRTYQLIPGTGDSGFARVPLKLCTDGSGHRVLNDQRGMPRPGKNKSSCDAGAYEYQAPS